MTEEVTPLGNQYFYLSLSRARAKALQHKLAGVSERYTPFQDEAETAYGVRLALTPLCPE